MEQPIDVLLCSVGELPRHPGGHRQVLLLQPAPLHRRSPGASPPAQAVHHIQVYITGVGPRNKNSISYFGASGQKITKVFAKLFLPMNTGNH